MKTVNNEIGFYFEGERKHLQMYLFFIGIQCKILLNNALLQYFGIIFSIKHVYSF